MHEEISGGVSIKLGNNHEENFDRIFEWFLTNIYLNLNYEWILTNNIETSGLNPAGFHEGTSQKFTEEVSPSGESESESAESPKKSREISDEMFIVSKY